MSRAFLKSDVIDDPAAVLATPKKTLRAAGLSENKALALYDLAKQKLPTRREMEKLSDEEIVARLVPIRGVGKWTVQMMLMFYLGRPDVLPLDDLGVQQGFALTFGKRTLARMADTWRPYASVASWYMWRAMDLKRFSV